MKLYEINPYVRFASPINYKAKHNPVKVTDYRIFYVTGGKADILIENQHYSLEPNSLLYCCGGSEYNIEAPNGFSPICINFDLSDRLLSGVGSGKGESEKKVKSLSNV